MKAKVRKHKKSPALVAAEQVKEKSRKITISLVMGDEIINKTIINR
ncbi:MAG: hypothetical protein NC485_13905 [Ruminococcus flavefaciens]|nr:hypothetical protein [Ruminococcus flavefaciens]MCM1062575.1 hypothetical protein [Eubacterium sp.]